LGDLKRVILSEVLVVEEATEDDVVESTLVLQSLDVLGGVRVDALEGADELVIKTLDVRDNAARDLDVLLTLLQGRGLVIVVPLLSVLDNNIVVVVLEDLEKA
jgi:chemotaxis protein histidine kinase CheA